MGPLSDSPPIRNKAKKLGKTPGFFAIRRDVTAVEVLIDLLPVMRIVSSFIKRQNHRIREPCDEQRLVVFLQRPNAQPLCFKNHHVVFLPGHMIT
jgi:hypothetical protein